MLQMTFTIFTVLKSVTTVIEFHNEDVVILLFDESSTLHQADPGTADPAQREPCFTAACEKIPVMLRSHNQSFCSDWTECSSEGLRGELKTSDSSTLAACHSLVSTAFFFYIFQHIYIVRYSFENLTCSCYWCFPFLIWRIETLSVMGSHGRTWITGNYYKSSVFEVLKKRWINILINGYNNNLKKPIKHVFVQLCLAHKVK